MSDAFSLILDGDLELCGGEDPDGAFWFETLAQGASFGDPAPVEVAIASLLRDGSLVERTSDGNRAVTFQITIKSTDPAGVAQGRARLDRLLGRRTTLVWRDGDYPATVLLVETSSAVRPSGFDDLEYLRNEETVALRFECLPYARSENKILDVSTSPPGSGAGTVFYSAESTTGWAGFAGGYQDQAASFSVDTSIKNEGTGSVKSLLTEWEEGFTYGGPPYGPYYAPHGGTSRDEVTGLSLDTDMGGYVSVAIRFDPVYNLSRLEKIWQSTTAGAWVEVTNWAAIKYESNGFVHYRWAVDDGLTILGLRFQAFHERSGQWTSQTRPYVWYDDFKFTDVATTEQQIIKNITVEGSARTVGSLRIESGTESVALGQVLVATVPTEAIPAGFSPETRPYVTQGTLTSDPDAQGGAYYLPDPTTYNTGAGYPIFDVPVRMLQPGAYTVVNLVQTDNDPVTTGVQAQLNIDGTLTGSIQTAEVNAIPPFSETAEWQFVTVGTLILPPVPMENADTTTSVRLTFKGDPLANCYLIPAWSVGGRPVADFSIIDCGTGLPAADGPSSFLWIDSPDANQPQGGYWRGPASDRLNARSAWPDAIAPGIHAFPPGEITAFLAVTASQAPTLALEYFPAWHGSAAI